MPLSLFVVFHLAACSIFVKTSSWPSSFPPPARSPSHSPSLSFYLKAGPQMLRLNCFWRFAGKVKTWAATFSFFSFFFNCGFCKSSRQHKGSQSEDEGSVSDEGRLCCTEDIIVPKSGVFLLLFLLDVKWVNFLMYCLKVYLLSGKVGQDKRNIVN